MLEGLAGELEAHLERPELERQSLAVAAPRRGGGEVRMEVADERRGGGGPGTSTSDAVMTARTRSRLTTTARSRPMRLDGYDSAGSSARRSRAGSPVRRISWCFPIASTRHAPAEETTAHSAPAAVAWSMRPWPAAGAGSYWRGGHPGRAGRGVAAGFFTCTRVAWRGVACRRRQHAGECPPGEAEAAVRSAEHVAALWAREHFLCGEVVNEHVTGHQGRCKIGSEKTDEGGRSKCKHRNIFNILHKTLYSGWRVIIAVQT